MDLSLTILICSGVSLVLALIFVFYGYRLARFLLPLCGTAAVLGALWAFVYDALQLNTMGTWLFFCGTGVTVYILLFFLKRIAGFFTGVAGAALLLLYVVYALDLSGIPFLYPACFTICALAGLLTVVYHKPGVIASTALFGACAAAFIGLYIYLRGVDAAVFAGGILPPLKQFLTEQKYLVVGVSLVATVLGILVQALATASRQVLSGDPSEPRQRKSRKNSFIDENTPDAVLNPPETPEDLTAWRE